MEHNLTFLFFLLTIINLIILAHAHAILNLIWSSLRFIYFYKVSNIWDQKSTQTT